MRRATLADDIRAEWTPFSLELRNEWLAFLLGPAVLFWFAARVWRRRHPPIAA